VSIVSQVTRRKSIKALGNLGLGTAFLTGNTVADSNSGTTGGNEKQMKQKDVPSVEESNVVYIPPEEVEWPDDNMVSSDGPVSSSTRVSKVNSRCLGGQIARIGVEVCPNDGDFEVSVSLLGVLVGNYSFDGDVYKHTTSWQGAVPGAPGIFQRVDLTFYFDSVTDVSVQADFCYYSNLQWYCTEYPKTKLS
jgi:hypothetical protein